MSRFILKSLNQEILKIRAIETTKAFVLLKA